MWERIRARWPWRRSRPPREEAAALQHTDWKALLSHDWDRWQEALAAARGGRPVLIATGVGGNLPISTLDGILAVALTLRGAEVTVLLCDACLNACEYLSVYRVGDGLEGFARRGTPRDLCRRCYPPARRMFEDLGVRVLTYGDLVSPRQVRRARRLAEEMPAAEIPAYTQEGIRVGEHALAGALRFFARGDLENEPLGEPVLRRYFQAALQAAAAVSRLLEQRRFLCASFHHGIYVPQGLVGEVARSKGVRVANWQPAYRKKSFIFSHHDTYHHTMLTEPTASWENVPWSEELERVTLDYLASRIHGTRDWIYFHENPREDVAEVVAQVGLKVDKPWVGLLTNVIWDAQLHYPANAFPGMKDWVLETIAYFARRSELQLVIRIHPAEIRGGIPSRQLVADEIAAAFPRLPDNVFVFGPESDVSTYALMERCDAVVIYGTKTGVELTSMGVPVIVAGEAWIRGKGLTRDAGSREEYFAILDELPWGRRLDQDTVRRARMYAFHFFFRRMIPVGCVEPAGGKAAYRVRISGLDDLAPGRDPGLEVICRGILEGEPFVYPAESFPGGSHVER